jgi:hypothetical protein
MGGNIEIYSEVFSGIVAPEKHKRIHIPVPVMKIQLIGIKEILKNPDRQTLGIGHVIFYAKAPVFTDCNFIAGHYIICGRSLFITCSVLFFPG